MKLKEGIKGYVDISTKMISTTPQYIEIEGYASTIDKDRDGDIVHPFGMDIENFMKNPILLYQHDKSKPIGKVTDIKIDGNGIYVKARVYRDLSKEAYTAVKEGILKTFSIGFIGKEGEYLEDDDTFIFTKGELLEVSVVSVPANANATFQVIESPCGEGFCLAGKQFSKNYGEYMEKAIDKITIKNSEISTRPWGDVDKTRLAQLLDDLNATAAIKECYLYVEDLEKRSTWCCPHHEVKADGTMVVNKGGVIAAYQALKGAHGNTPNIPESAYASAFRHLAKHYREMYRQGLIDSIPEDLNKYLESDEVNEKALSDFMSMLEKETGLSRRVLTKILLFLQFTIYKKDGSLTTFASKYKLGSSKPYRKLYDTIKKMKQEYKNDNEIVAFGEYMREMALSTVSRASAWIYTTYLARQSGDEQEKLLQARTFAESWFFNALSVVIDNLKVFEKVIDTLDENKENIDELVGSTNYTNRKDYDMEKLDAVLDELKKVSELLAKSLEDKQDKSQGETGNAPQEDKLTIEAMKEFAETMEVEELMKLYADIEGVLNKKLDAELNKS